MKELLNDIRKYYYELDKKYFALTVLFTTGLIFLNYFFGIDDRIIRQDAFAVSFFSRWGIFLLAFSLPYYFYLLINQKNYFKDPLFVFLLISAPAFFAFKTSLSISIPFTGNANWNDYWNQVIYWPMLLVIFHSICIAGKWTLHVGVLISTSTADPVVWVVPSFMSAMLITMN